MLRTMTSLHPLRPEAVAGSWYPGEPESLAREVDQYLSAVPDEPVSERVFGLVVPHAGLMYWARSRRGPIAPSRAPTSTWWS